MQENELERVQAREADSLQAILKSDNKEHKIELLLRREGEPQEDEINIKDIALKLGRGKKIVAFITLLAFVLSTLGSFVYIFKQDYRGTASSIISFNFEGIDKGLDPQGETFDIYEIKNAEILDTTIQELGLAEKKITVDGLKRNISISSIMPADIMKRVLIINQMAQKDSTNLEKLIDMEYHPVEYKLDVTFPTEFKISSTEARQILDTITDNYKDYFLKKYSDREALNTAVNKIDFGRYDYPEFVMLAESQLNVIKDYTAIKANKSPNFRAKSTQMTFGDISSQIRVLEDVDLNRIQSLVNSFMLTKDADKLIAIYDNSITKKQLDVIKKEEQAKSLTEQANNYKKDTSIMLMPGTDSTTPMEINEASRTYDTLIESSAAFTNEATQLKADISYYEQLIQRLKNKSVTNQVLKNSDVEKYKADVETQVEYLTKTMADIVELINKTVDEYFETEVFKDAVKINVPATYVSNMRENMKTAFLIIIGGTFFGLMLGMLLALGKDIFKEQNEGKGTSI